MENACACLNIIKIEVNFRSLFFHDSIIKTFLNHSILLSKLQIYGCLSSTIQWFTSYLSDRSQCTNVKGALSDPLPVSIGVPQGSILGPLFFLLFINDLPLFLPQNTTLTMFADDTSITQSSSTIHELNARLNLVASGVFAWANLNDMALNTSKTKSILITTQQKFHRLNDHSLNVMIDGKLIEQVQHVKLLGVTLDCHLEFYSCVAAPSGNVWSFYIEDSSRDAKMHWRKNASIVHLSYVYQHSLSDITH